MIGEKQVYTPHHREEDSVGYMQINSYVYLEDGKLINGDMRLIIDSKN